MPVDICNCCGGTSGTCHACGTCCYDDGSTASWNWGTTATKSGSDVVWDSGTTGMQTEEIASFSAYLAGRWPLVLTNPAYGPSDGFAGCQWTVDPDPVGFEAEHYTLIGNGSGSWFGSYGYVRTELPPNIWTPDNVNASFTTSAALGTCCGATTQSVTGAVVVTINHGYIIPAGTNSDWSGILPYLVGAQVGADFGSDEIFGNSYKARFTCIQANLGETPGIGDSPYTGNAYWAADIRTVSLVGHVGDTGTFNAWATSLCCSDGTNCSYTGTNGCTSNTSTGRCLDAP